MAVVGEAAVEHLVLEVIGDLRRMPTAPSGTYALVSPFAIVMSRARPSSDRREPLAGAAEAGHHLVADHQDAVLVAQRAHALQVAVGRHEDAVGAGDRSRG
jgi:hypothetical protein